MNKFDPIIIPDGASPDDYAARLMANRRAPIVLVACCGRKLDRAARAEDLYTSDLFKKARAWAEKFGLAWYILSAKHGIVPPGRVIKPYDLTLAGMTPYEVEVWNLNIAKTLAPHADRDVVVLAGERYCAWTAHRTNVIRPVKGMGIGQQKSWLKAQVAG